MSKKETNITREERFLEDKENLLFDRIKIALNEHEVVKIENKIRGSFPKVVWFKRRLVKIAAFFFLIASLSIALYTLYLPRNKKVFYEYYTPYSAEKISGIYRDNQTEKNGALHYYSRRRYDQALPLLNNYLINKPGDSEVRLLLAICLMEENRYKEAREKLEDILKDDGGFFMEDATWYLSLIDIRQGDFGSALTHLKKIEDSRVYGSKIAALQKKIAGQKQK
jgi:tetratricopeptide (TPR) repeat protein